MHLTFSIDGLPFSLIFPASSNSQVISWPWFAASSRSTFFLMSSWERRFKRNWSHHNTRWRAATLCPPASFFPFPVDANINIREAPAGRHLCQKFYIDSTFVFPVSFFCGRNIFSLCFPCFTFRPSPAFVCENIEGNGEMPFSLIKWRIIFLASFVLQIFSSK